MKKKLVVLGIIAFFVGACFPSNAEAGLWGTNLVNEADFMSSRSYDATLYGNYPGLVVEWDIDQDGEYWVYRYTLSGSKDISHWLMEVTSTSNLSDIECATYTINDVTTALDYTDPEDVEFGTWAPGASGNKYLPQNLYGVKFGVAGGEEYPLTYSFRTKLSPVWGNAYFKDGKGGDIYAYNFAMRPEYSDSSNPLHYIARPNGVIPEPTTLSLLGLGLFGLVGFRRKKNRI